MKTDVLSLIHAPQYAEFVLSSLTTAEILQIDERLLKALQDPRLVLIRHLLDTLKVLIDVELESRRESGL
ncbi:hypothetical protein C7S18_21285 [Ahniella affigens]|uniref:Uncharacterized protein n=1 Tax=Ahniella affigens TaxID=2021234 RepID=A0A2P1PXH7_9GAMM|nr:hypothetical protein [Ahniella affigens]AVP99551.1 hypothetical protein C7S18_21285 [Ahniella affigens]